MICPRCGREYYFNTRMRVEGNEIRCEHDVGRRVAGMEREEVLQPYNGDGSLNRDFERTYPKSEFVRDYYEKGRDKIIYDRKKRKKGAA